MFASLRVVVWRVLDHSRRGVLQHGRTANTTRPDQVHEQIALYNYLRHPLAKPVPGSVRPRGRGGGQNGPSNSAVVQPNNATPIVGILGRLRPFVSGAVRRLAESRRSRRDGVPRWDTAPLFALVGVSVMAGGSGADEEEEAEAASRKCRGFVTRQEEMEALCGTIRAAVLRTEWLYEPQTWQPRLNRHHSPSPAADHSTSGHAATASSQDSAASGQESVAGRDNVYSLDDLELAGVIDKGCNAVVYAARWKDADLHGNQNEGINGDNTDMDVEHNSSNDNDHHDNINITHDDGIHNTFEGNANQSSDFNVDDFNLNTLCNTSNSNRNLNELTLSNSANLIDSNFLYKLNSDSCNLNRRARSASYSHNIDNENLLSMTNFSRNSTASLSAALSSNFGRPNSLFEYQEEQLEQQQQQMGGGSPINAAKCLLKTDLDGGESSRSHRNSLSADVGLLLSSGGFGTPTRQKGTPKRVRFVPSAGEKQAGEEEQRNLKHSSSPSTASSSLTSTTAAQQSCPERFPLAVKLVFNYEAASNAPAILSALYRELLPARSVRLDDLYTSWRDNFFGDAEHTLLPYHPNVVDMPCAFVDRVPLLKGGLQLYPTALPPRLNPDGYGRNMSLFCVMRRYHLSLAAYLEQHPQPPPHTSLLLLTQLLEALQHLEDRHISHRDIKPDNLLISLSEEWERPWLVLTDFGCCLAGGSAGGLAVPFVSREGDPRQGNAALMAPEVKTARPGLLKSIDFSRCDLWAAGTLAYQMYGLPNPFLKQGTEAGGMCLESGSYRESQLPGLGARGAPPAIRRLVGALCRRRPGARPSASIAATLCQLSLWAPSSWLNRHTLARPKPHVVMEWLLSLTTKVLCEKRTTSSGVTAREAEYRMVTTFLARVRYTDVMAAINWIRAI